MVEIKKCRSWAQMTVKKNAVTSHKKIAEAKSASAFALKNQYRSWDWWMGHTQVFTQQR